MPVTIRRRNLICSCVEDLRLSSFAGCAQSDYNLFWREEQQSWTVVASPTVVSPAALSRTVLSTAVRVSTVASPLKLYPLDTCIEPTVVSHIQWYLLAKYYMQDTLKPFTALVKTKAGSTDASLDRQIIPCRPVNLSAATTPGWGTSSRCFCWAFAPLHTTSPLHALWQQCLCGLISLLCT